MSRTPPLIMTALVVLLAVIALSSSSRHDAEAAPAESAPATLVCVEWTMYVGELADRPTPWEPIGVVPATQTTRGRLNTPGSSGIAIVRELLVGATTQLETPAVLYRGCTRYGTIHEATAAFPQSLPKLPASGKGTGENE